MTYWMRRSRSSETSATRQESHPTSTTTRTPRCSRIEPNSSITTTLPRGTFALTKWSGRPRNSFTQLRIASCTYRYGDQQPTSESFKQILKRISHNASRLSSTSCRRFTKDCQAYNLAEQLINACQGVEACTPVLMKPAASFESVASDLR